jgi:hypothetical protein
LQVHQLDIVSVPASVTGPRARRPAGRSASRMLCSQLLPPFTTPPPNHRRGKITSRSTASGERTSLQKVIKVNTATHFILVTKQPDGQAKNTCCVVLLHANLVKKFPFFIVHSLDIKFTSAAIGAATIGPKDLSTRRKHTVTKQTQLP